MLTVKGLTVLHQDVVCCLYLCLCYFTNVVYVSAFPGPVCGKLDASQKNVTLKSNEVTITFKSGPHRSGRGFLMSYATDQYPGNTSVYYEANRPNLFGSTQTRELQHKVLPLTRTIN